MNILHINQSYIVRGGVEVYIHQLQELLPKFGITTSFIAISEPNEVNKFKVTGKNLFLSNKTKNEVEQFLTLYIEKNKIDLIHIHSVSNKDLTKFCLEKKPVIRTIHEPRMFCPGRQKFLSKSESICNKPFGLHCCIKAYTEKCQDSRIPNEVIRSYSNVKFEINFAAKRYKRIVAMSNYAKNEAVLAGISEQNIVVNSCFTPVISESIKKNNDLYSIKRIVFVGRLHPSKGIHILIKSLSNILKSEHNVVLDIIGDGLFKNELLNLISSENIPSEKIIFHGWLSHEETTEKIEEAYLIVFPSIYPETFGIVGIEAMMRSKPVVAFDVGGVSDWLENNITGFLVEVKNEKMFEEKVYTLLSDEKLYNIFSLNARKIVLDKFIPEIHITKLVELYRS